MRIKTIVTFFKKIYTNSTISLYPKPVLISQILKSNKKLIK